jgi:hypothetical protein
MVRYFVIAARNRSDFYGYLKRQFSPEDQMQVLLDRRRDERRHRLEAHDPERRRGDRRSRQAKDDWLQYYGLLIVRQPPEVERRPSWLRPGMPEDSVGVVSQARAEGSKEIEGHERVIEWVTEGQRLFNFVPRLFQEHGHLTGRAEAAERKCERLEQEVRALRGENESFRKERRQIVESLKTLARQLVESAAEKFQ